MQFTRRVPTLEQKHINRWWASVIPTEGCWHWTAYIIRNGYGLLRVGKHCYGAHRVAWTLHRGTIPDGVLVLHKCDNPGCVNPSHLYLGDHKANAIDRMTRNRGNAAHGSKHYRARLTEERVVEIRRLRPTHTLAQLAAKYGVTKEVVCDAARGLRLWKHVTEPPVLNGYNPFKNGAEAARCSRRSI